MAARATTPVLSTRCSNPILPTPSSPKGASLIRWHPFFFFSPHAKNIKGETFRPRESTTWIYRPIAHELVSDGIGMSACDCNMPDTYFRQNDLG